MPLYPTYSPRIANTTFATVEYLNELQDNIQAIVMDAYRAKGTKTTLNSLIKTTLSSLGIVKSGVIRHPQLTDITEDQHHIKLHGDTHTNNIDPIPFATSTARGLISATNAVKINSMQSSASFQQVATFIYRGNGVPAGKYISLGFSPKLVLILYDYGGTNSFQAEAIDVASFSYFHSRRADLGALKHYHQAKANSILITTYGIKVYNSCNRTMATTSTSKFFGLAIRGSL